MGCGGMVVPGFSKVRIFPSCGIDGAVLLLGFYHGAHHEHEQLATQREYKHLEGYVSMLRRQSGDIRRSASEISSFSLPAAASRREIDFRLKGREA
jgi:hypothetical protein